MQHLDTERLAALADEPPTADEAAHLGHCLVCRRERDVYVALLDLAQRSSTAELDAPISDWNAIAAALRDDAAAAVTAELTPAVVPATWQQASRRSGANRGWLRAAASVAIMTGSLAVGRMSAGADALPSAGELRTALAGRGAQVAAEGDVAGRSTGGLGAFDVHPVADTVTPSFASVTEAAQVLARSQREYLRAAAFLAAHDSTRPPTGDQEAYRARLAALDEMMPTLRAALYEAPQDPVLNQYYLTTYDTRENTLRELGRALPSGVTLNRY
jgi:hypothetical protein